MPSVKSIADIKSALLNPATTSHFEVFIPKPLGLTNTTYLSDNGVRLDQGKLNLLCSDAVLPGSSFMTHDINGDYHGSVHRHAYRRTYDDRIDLSFYVNAENYMPIKFFEAWMKYIAGEQISTIPNVKDEQYFYRMNYPDLYIAKSGFTVTKFERSSLGGVKGTPGGTLTYNFVNVFPIALNSMAVSYDSSSLLKCTVSFSYIRYFVLPIGTAPPVTTQTQNFNLSPRELAALNSQAFNPNANPIGLDYSKYTTTGGVSLPASNSSANTIKQAFSGRSII